MQDEPKEQNETFETWKPILGYEVLYEVSDFGRVRRIGKAAMSRMGHGGGVKVGRIRKPQEARGYSSCILYKNGIAKSFFIHRLVASAFSGPIPEKYEVNHKNGNKVDNRLENLEIVTASENNLHAFRTGLKKTKLTNRQVESIRKDYERLSHTHGCNALAKKYGVSGSMIIDIVNKKYWNSD